MYTGILLMELGQFLQKQHMHGGVTGPYGNSAGLKASVPLYLLLSQSELLKGYGDTIVEPFSLGSKSDPAVRTDKELAAKLLFKYVHAAGYVRLIIAKELRRMGEAVAFCYIIEYTVIVIRDSHDIFSDMSIYYFRIYKISIVERRKYNTERDGFQAVLMAEPQS